MLNTLIFIFMAIVGGVPCVLMLLSIPVLIVWKLFTVNVNIIYRCMINFILLFLKPGMCPNTCTT